MISNMAVTRDELEGVKIIMPSKQNDEASIQPRVYKKRWIMLALFCSLSLSSAYQWIQYSIIGQIITGYYNVPWLAIDWTSMIYMLGYIPFVFPATWLLDKYGLRLSALLGSLGTCLGAWIKCASTSPDRFAVTFLGQTVVGCSQVFILGIPPRLAAVWFGPNEVSTATALGVFGNQVGIALGFYVPPAIVRTMITNSSFFDWDDANNTGNFTALLNQIGSELQVLFFSTAAFTTLVLILIFFIFTDAPPVAPSRAQSAAIAASIESNYLRSLKKLLKNGNYLLLVVTYGLNVGVFYGVSTLLVQTLSPYYGDDSYFYGIIGFAVVIAGMFGSIVCGFILDRTHQFKFTTLIVYICSVCGMLGYTLTVWARFDLWIIFGVACFLGFFMTGYLPVGFEYGAELTYPCSEGTQSGLLNASAQVFGIILVLGMGDILRIFGSHWCNGTMVVILGIGAILTGFIKSDLRRQRANFEAKAAEENSAKRDEELTRFIPNQSETSTKARNDPQRNGLSKKY